ncbi:disease resistance protein RGA2-like [Papaver somniferum]|uniref:disease resistance protein RGA2-like n=1 Tax=Papaver somniferum TaxID=3469 RepID=UPI000E7012C4|nr:disease resistance protein RGA2-like [Papaver somniferum]XP_026421990.1 disease resistance protein RGA2-like [Papaver somniferum]
MAEVLIIAASESLMSRLVSIASDGIYLVGSVKDEMLKLQGTLLGIQTVLSDAEKQQVEKDAVKIWLRELKDIIYEAEDILDEFAYETVRRKMLIQGRKRNRVKNFFSPSNTLAFRVKMARKVKDLNQMLDKVAKEKDMFCFDVSTQRNTTSKDNVIRIRGTSSLVGDSSLIGRENDKSKIIDVLTNISNSEQIYRILLIVGMGGIGKTKLVQSVYGDNVVIRHFEKRLWVCISQNSNLKQIFGKLLESITGTKKDISNLDVMVNSLKENLQNKRYLIVLEEMWNNKHNEWDDMLKTLLPIGAHGSKVIVTTPSNEVTLKTRSVYRYSLERLSNEECWTLFQKIAFGSGGVEKTEKLIKIGKNIAKKCGGLPLATKLLGGMMYSKRGENEWLSVENNVIWNHPEGEEKIIKILKLRYDHLEPHLKQCFAHCSLFPKDHIFKRKKVIQQWMAEGFLSPGKESAEMEKIGNEYFNTLLRYSFFQDEQKNELGGIKSCKMHDLVHDLAQSVARTECSMINLNKKPEEEINGLRRVSLVFENEFSFVAMELSKVKKLRTFISTTPEFIDNTYAMQIFMNFSHIRVLDLSCNAITELPPSIAKLKHLRYLNLSNSRLSKLPNSITTLYHLQSLILKNCFELKDLPRGMKKLINLRHLIICKSQANAWIPPMPREVRNLSCLRYLPVFVVGKDSGFRIEELRDLNLLGGKLQIHNLENVRDGNDAQGACLKDKQHIVRLELYWTENETCNDVVRDDFDVLEGLQPHPNLRRLGIHYYVGSKFPTWMMRQDNVLPNLVFVVLLNCSKCEYLPSLGSLPFLKVLKIVGLVSVQTIGSEFYGSNNGEVSSFRSLEELSLIGMPNLLEWSDHMSSPSSASSSFPSSFPRLERLEIKACHKLTIMPNRFPFLKVLKLEHCNGEPVSSLVDSNLTSLTSVDIAFCKELVFLPRGLLRGNNMLQSLEVSNCEMFQGFNPDQELDEEGQSRLLPNNSLDSLSLFNCPALVSWPDLRGFNSLWVLGINVCKRQKSIPNGIEHLPKLVILGIGGFSEELESSPFPAFNNEEGTLQRHYFPSLRTLYIYGWSKLKCLPDQIQYLTSLQYLLIYNFDSLEALPEWLGNLASLRYLSIWKCENLKYMPSAEQMQRLTSLQQLEIHFCPLLVDRCIEGGEEYSKISHIPNVTYF